MVTKGCAERREYMGVKLGVIGGLGPMATAYFLELLTAMTLADCDQEHIEALVYSRPQTPDRTSYILGKSAQSPLPMMLETLRFLESAGCGAAAIPCITSHCYMPQLQSAAGIPVINTVAETAILLKEENISCAGVMATSGTAATGLFQNALAAEGIQCVLPDGEHQALVMDIIYQNIKAGQPADAEKFARAAAYLRQSGAETIILGCTELSLVRRDGGAGNGFIDVLEVLAAKSIQLCGKALRRSPLYAT